MLFCVRHRSGLWQLALVVLMVILIHAVEAYILNPAIYSGSAVSHSNQPLNFSLCVCVCVCVGQLHSHVGEEFDNLWKKNICDSC